MAPLVSSTLTTVVVFAPLGLLSGVPGQFFRALSLSLSVAVLMSLALSITRRAADGALGVRRIIEPARRVARTARSRVYERAARRRWSRRPLVAVVRRGAAGGR